MIGRLAVHLGAHWRDIRQGLFSEARGRQRQLSAREWEFLILLWAKRMAPRGARTAERRKLCTQLDSKWLAGHKATICFRFTPAGSAGSSSTDSSCGKWHKWVPHIERLDASGALYTPARHFISRKSCNEESGNK